MKKSWKYLIASIVFLLFIAFIFNRFLAWNESREGIYFDDPIFKYYKAKDYSWFIMLTLYGAILFFVFYFRNQPIQLTRLVLAYALAIAFRMLTLYLFPFYADDDAVKLYDPVLNNFVYPNNYVERDLFYSGHAALLLLMMWIMPKGNLRWIYLVITLLVTVLLVLQKVHFSIDILAAPFFSLIALYLTDLLIQTIYKEQEKVE
jgi:hypothetical protein